ncbi:MAG: class I SAM-dependent methyltransferase [Hyphomicrobiales bacterium]|nr:class I SAM-dependent methyltransferase [Hyphomicrobiales bacterium]MCA1999530.1 class I SAM-dependent methyltransferase [Hyphomicrobiales bacterium]
MHLDIVDLKSFYASPLGEVARRMILRGIRARWDSLSGLALLGLGYPGPYLDILREGTERSLAFMPARQGVIAWPSRQLSAASLVEATDMPLRDSVVDRILVIHALETSEDPAQLMAELWRVLAPGGQIMIVVPNRRGPWARRDSTPFGHGQPFSRRQLTALLKQALFTPTHWGEALYVPPVQRQFFLRSALAWERVGAALALPFSGIYVIEATKQVYRPALAGKAQRIRGLLEPILVPSGGGAAGAAGRWASQK